MFADDIVICSWSKGQVEDVEVGPGKERKEG